MRNAIKRHQQREFPDHYRTEFDQWIGNKEVERTKPSSSIVENIPTSPTRLQRLLTVERTRMTYQVESNVPTMKGTLEPPSLDSPVLTIDRQSNNSNWIPPQPIDWLVRARRLVHSSVHLFTRWIVLSFVDWSMYAVHYDCWIWSKWFERRRTRRYRRRSSTQEETWNRLLEAWRWSMINVIPK